MSGRHPALTGAGADAGADAGKKRCRRRLPASGVADVARVVAVACFAGMVAGASADEAPAAAASGVGRSASSAVDSQPRLESDPGYLWWMAIASLVLGIGGYWVQRRSEEPEDRRNDLP